MKLWLIGGVLVVVVILAYMLVNNRSSEQQIRPKNTTIVAVGDSLVYGYGATPGNDFISALSRMLGLPIENFGKNGDTTAGVLARIDTVLASDPGVVILLIGGNDILRRVPIETTDANIRSIVGMLQANGTTVILVGVRGALFGDQYMPMYKSIAATYSLAYVPDILGGLMGTTAYMSDPIHPNDAGYLRIAERLHKVVAPLVE